MALTIASNLTRAPRCLRGISSKQVKTAGILVIGDEILKGDVIDSNSPHISKELHNLGVKVRKISIIGDEVDEISNEIKVFSNLYNYVITTGGIGPTHDDVTFEAVAKAFGVPLTLNGQLQKLCEKFYNTTDTNHPGMKLAKIPQTAKLTFADECNYPNISIENVYIFPGIPQLFLKSFNSLYKKLFKSDDTTFYTKVIYVNLTEDKIAEELGRLASAFPDVQVGSYPKLFNKFYQVKVTIESVNKKSVEEAFARLISKFPEDAVVNADNISV